ncbi:EAL domain-containing protein [Aestuariicella sp. G3-2]|uniref:putative bifunctional diguanylate cyclase/phosphodiesterase n=1 Tax=Pseudomaricurvus albidus TaxID=2842452 RepID=UPI001C0E8E07|nr:EAL domain-containing protein [Aestuariicella albida]MBU3070748.1 EAL domain-containing protein [Aestuariicella albida]
MQSKPEAKHTAVELIRKFQQLFKDLDHKQIAERLVTLVVTQPLIHRCVLVVCRDNKLHVESVAESGSSVSLSAPLESFQNLPQGLIRQVFQSGEAADFSISTGAELPPSLNLSAIKSEVNSVAVQPVGDQDSPVAVYYCESREDLAQLQVAMKRLESLWAFSGLMIYQVIQMRHYADQADKFRIAEQALWASETYLNAILYYSPALISVKDLDGNVVLASDHFKYIDGVSDEGYVGRNIQDVYSPELASKINAADMQVLETLEPLELEEEIRHKDGSMHSYWMVRFPLRDKKGKVFGLCSISTDITERKNAQDALRDQQSRLNYMAFHDSLTSLPNRALFYDRINHGLARARRSGNRLALMLLDLDRFKYINDSLGHDAGDLFLKALSKRLEENVRDMDTVARLGGDEFVLVLEGVHSDDDIAFVARKVLASVANPINVMEHEISTTASIGISVFPQDGDEADSLLKHADIAMYKAKEAGKDNFKFYADGMSASAVNFLLLENDLRRAIDTDQLLLYYQPQFDLQTGSLLGMEALVRWEHPERGLVSPAHFIPLAEETDLIVHLGDWVLRAACQQQKIWLREGKYSQKVSVNLSPRQLRERSFTKRVAEILRETGLPARYLELEITESSAMEHAGQTINMMNELNAMGVSLAIDDFGTGYSSLAYLKRFPIQKLKIDRSFINDIATDQNDAAIAKSIINLAHNMALNVVAEGVEYEDQAEWLRQQGCDMVQGFLYAKPMSAALLGQHLRGGEFYSSANVVPLNQLA